MIQNWSKESFGTESNSSVSITFLELKTSRSYQIHAQ